MDLDLARWQWSDNSRIGVDEIDSDHRHFGLLLGNLERAVSAGSEESVVEGHMRAIAQDALAHFDKEDRLLARYGYPDRYSHTRRHNDIRAILRPMARRDRGTLAMDAAAGSKWALSPVQLKVLLVSHLVHEDADFHDFLRTRNEH